MNEEIEERISNLERRVIANRTAITLLVSVLSKELGAETVHEALVSIGKAIPADEDESLDEIRELFVTLATVATRKYWDDQV